LWPELDQEHARAALRQALHGLRTSLGADALAGRGDEEVSLDDQIVWCDASGFEVAVDAGRLADALELYRGDLLEGFFISGAPDFERWLEDERARLRRRACEAAWMLAGSCRAEGDVALAAHWARRAVSLARGDEAALRRLIALLAELGDRAGAVQAYEAFARRLAEDYDVEPTAETQALIARVRSREIGPQPTATPQATHIAEPVRAGADDTRARQPPGAAGSRSLVRPLLIGAAVVVSLAVGASALFPRPRTPRLDPRRIVIVPFANRTGDSTLHPLGDWAADWIARGLAETGLVEVVDAGRYPAERDASGGGSERTAPRPRDFEPAHRARELAATTGSGTAVWGSFYRHGDSVEFAVRITDQRRGRLLRAIGPVAGDPRDPRAAIGALREQVTAALATLLDPKLSAWSGLASQPGSYEAYQAFAAGAEAWERFDGPEALRQLYRAVSLDSAYTLALVWAAALHRYLNECNKTDSIARVLSTRREMPPLDRYFLEKEVARCRGDLAAVYRASRRMYEVSPASEYMAEQLARDALALDRPREALRILEVLEPTRGELRGRTSYYLWLTASYHWIEDHRRELEAARRARRQYPNNLATLRQELLALAALGRVREIKERLDGLHTVAPHGYQRPEAVIRQTALELRAHGHRDADDEVLRRAIAWVDPRSRGEGATEASRHERLKTLYAARRWGDALPLAEQLAAERPDSVSYQGILGSLVAVSGDREEASRVDSQLASRRDASLRGLQTYWRACIAAALGERGRAVTLLVQADAEGLVFSHRRFLHADPCFEGLRDYSPFEELLKPKG
jgi:serine/threonine-protein kinase